ncbi:MAG: NADH dehydrogenase, partial [Candidatus Azambacteria bacterium GW2011_GWC2_45_7b]
PMTASVAIREAKYVAKNIKKMILKKPLIDYKPYHAGFVVPLGGKYAIMEIGGLRLSGFLPWALKHLVSLHYWNELIGWRRALGIWKRGLRIYTEND